MNTQREFTKSLSDTHIVNLVFEVGVTKFNAGKLSVNFKVRDQFVSGISSGALSALVDYLARIAGQENLGDSFISECEISFPAPCYGEEFVASAQVSASGCGYATYCCEIHALEGAKRRLVAESHGTLMSCACDGLDMGGRHAQGFRVTEPRFN